MAQLAGEVIRVAAPVVRSDAGPLAVSSDRPRVALVLGVFAAIALLSLVYVSLASVVSSMGYEVGSLESARDYWKLQNDQLGLQVAEAHSLANVERQAKRLGMGPPQQVIYLPADPTPAPSVEAGSPAPKPSTWTEDLAAWLRGLW